MEEYRAKFLSVYTNIPLNVRDDVVLVLDDRPISWNVAYLEVVTHGPQAEKILTDLVELEIIK